MRKVVIVPYDQYLFLTNHQLSKQPIDMHVLDTTHEESASSLPQSQPGMRFNVQQENEEQPISMETDLILTPFSKNQIRNAESILKFVSKNMSWNELGELIIGGEVIKGSHVTDLIKDCLSIRERKWEPVGFEYFYGNLYDIPLSLVFNVKRRPLLGSGKSPIKNRDSPANKQHFQSNEPVYAKKRRNNSWHTSEWIEEWQPI